jgi:hypothetical protein
MSQGKIKEKGRKFSLSALHLLDMNNKLPGKYALDALLRYDTSRSNLMYLLRYLTRLEDFIKLFYAAFCTTGRKRVKLSL